VKAMTSLDCLILFLSRKLIMILFEESYYSHTNKLYLAICNCHTFQCMFSWHN